MSVAHVKAGSPARRRAAGGVGRATADRRRTARAERALFGRRREHVAWAVHVRRRRADDHLQRQLHQHLLPRRRDRAARHPRSSTSSSTASTSASPRRAPKTSTPSASPISTGRKPSTYEEMLSDGRIVNITHRPLASGGWVSIYEDITEQRRAEQELKEQHRRFDAALANMSQGLLMYDAERQADRAQRALSGTLQGQRRPTFRSA